MVDFNSQFLDFLKAYDSSAYADVTAMAPDDPKAKEAFETRKNEIYAKWKDKEALWETVPQIIRDRYSGRPLPQDILDAAMRNEVYTLRAMEYDPSIKTVEDARERVREIQNEAKKWTDVTTEVAIGVAITAAVAGYSTESCHNLAIERQFRDNLLTKIAAGGLLSPEDKALWLQSRERDRKTIENDFRNHQPEKMLIHLLSRYNRGKVDHETFARDIAELIKKVETEGRQDHLLNYLKNDRIRAKLNHFNPETLDILKKNILPYIPTNESKGIMENIKPKARTRRTQNVNERPEEPTRRRVRRIERENVRTLS